MGTSNWQNISYCCEIIQQLAPRKTLDIGVGSLGRWALLVREFTEVWNGRVNRGSWTGTVDGIEAFAGQINNLHSSLYDTLYIGDAFEVLDNVGRYDLIIMGDVLEHFEEEKTKPIVQRCLRKSRRLIVSTPLGGIDDWHQTETYGNPWEQHRAVFDLGYFLDAPEWSVLQYKLFKDSLCREFGTFLLGKGDSI